MHAPADHSRVNWQLGLRAVLASMALAGVSGASGSPLPLLGAIVIAAWAVIRPLRMGRWLMQGNTLRGAAAVLGRLIAVVLIAAPLSFAVNSASPVLNIPGTLLFMALTVTVAVSALRFAWERSRVLVPRIWASSLEAAAILRTHAQAAWGAARHG
jgi:hypothetical protein